MDVYAILVPYVYYYVYTGGDLTVSVEKMLPRVDLAELERVRMGALRLEETPLQLRSSRYISFI